MKNLNVPQKQKLTSEGKRVLQVLQVEYQMNEQAALKLMKDGGTMLAIAILRIHR